MSRVRIVEVQHGGDCPCVACRREAAQRRAEHFKAAEAREAALTHQPFAALAALADRGPRK